MALLVGVDLGTTGLKVLIVNENGSIKAVEESNYFYDVPLPGYAEQNPDIWWDATVNALQRAVLKVDKRDIAAISFSGQMHGLVPMDKERKVIRNAILHCDQRSHTLTEHVNGLFPDSGFSRITYNPVFPGFMAMSLKWIKENEPHNYGRIEYAICPKDFIRFRLCGEIGVEVTDASGTLAFDMEKGDWSQDIIKTLELDRTVFPSEINNSSDVAGSLTARAAEMTGLPVGIPVVFGGGDQPMQLLGSGAIENNQMTVTLGSSGQVSVVTERPVLNPLYNTHTFCSPMSDKWFCMGGILSAGAAMNWFRKTFMADYSYQDMDLLASEIPCCSEGLVFFPCLAGERTPYLDSFTRGMMFGMSYYHSLNHFARAVMEGITFQAKTSIELINSLGYGSQRVIVSGGAVKSKLWLQIQSDIYGRELVMTDTDEQSALGAAITAGVGAGIFNSFEEGCSQMVKYQDRIVTPNIENHKKYNDFYNSIYMSMYENNKGSFKDLNHFLK